MEGDQIDAEREEMHTGNMQLEEKYVASALQGYSVDHIVHDSGKGDNVKYMVRWYNDMPASDTEEPPFTSLGISLDGFGAQCGNKTEIDRAEKSK